MIHLGENAICNINEEDYSIQGNGILGLKESGKSFTAKKCAEGLLNKGYPIVVFDPSGVWKHLRVKRQGKAFPIVALGTVDCDLQLSEEVVKDVLLAARERGISLIVDLFSNRNKSAWRRIVGDVVDTLMDHNAQYGVCHLFIEEAREFAPQRVMANMTNIYSKIETLGAVGGNSSVGYTLINQRAEDVNKSVLELCERMIIHNQSGKNSLKGMEDWFTRSRIDETILETMMQSLPRLGKGECWVIEHTAHEPIRTHVLALETNHPDRRKPETQVKIQKAGVDVSTFVAEIRKTIEKKVQVPVGMPEHRKRSEMPSTDSKGDPVLEAAIERALNAEQRADAAGRREQDLRTKYDQAQGLLKEYRGIFTLLRTTFADEYNTLKKLMQHTEEAVAQSPSAANNEKYELWMQKLPATHSKLLQLFIDAGKPFTKQQLMVATGLSRETVRIYTQKLVAIGLLQKDGDEWRLKE